MTKFITAVAGVLLTAGLASAHSGARIFLGNDAGRVATYVGNNNESSTAFVAERIFTQELPNFLGSGIYTTDFPGYQVAEGKGVPAGTSFTFDIAGPLLYFDDYTAASGTGTYRSVAAAFAGGAVPQLAVSQDANVRVTSSGAVAGFAFFNYGAAGDHGHNFHTLFGNGASASDGPSGVYALPLDIAANGLAESQTFYLLLGKDVAPGSAEFLAAEAVARATLVPEPATLAAIGLSTLTLVRRRRSTR